MLKIFMVQGKTDWVILSASIALSLGTGFIGRFLIQDPKKFYNKLILPEFAPPAYVFLPVWIILYIMIGIAIYRIILHDSILREDTDEKIEEDIAEAESFLVAEADKESLEFYSKTYAYIFFAVQLLANFLWSVIFFRLEQPLYALVDIIILVIFIGFTIWEFYKFDKMASKLLLPYLIWVLFACSLNFGIVALNTLQNFKFY